MESLEKIADSSNPNTTLVVLSDSVETQLVLEASRASLEGQFTVWFGNAGRLAASDLVPTARKVATHLDELGIKRATLIAFDSACNIATMMLASNPQLVRRAVFVDPPGTEQHGFFTRVRERLQKMCAVPLPFRLDPDVIDLRPFQHRISCPLIILQSTDLEEDWIKQCQEFAARAPNAWFVECPVVNADSSEPRRLTEQFLALLAEFIEVPAKRSQKNLAKVRTVKKEEVASPSSEQETSFRPVGGVP